MEGQTDTPRAGRFTAVQLLVVIGCIYALASLLLPACQRALIQSSRRDRCMRTISDLGWAALAFEHTRNKLPAAMDRDFGAALTKAGATGKNGAYSSIFMLMPYLEEAVLFNNVHTNTGRLVQGPFSVGTTPGATAGGAWAGPDCAAPHAAHLVMPLLRCPSGGGLFHVSTTVYAGGVRTSVTATDVSCSGTACGATSYHALVGANVSSGTVAEEHAGAIVLNPVSSRGATVGLTGVTIDDNATALL